MKKYIIPITISLLIVGGGIAYGATILYPHAGGTGQDFSNATGTVRVDAGVFSASTTLTAKVYRASPEITQNVTATGTTINAHTATFYELIPDADYLLQATPTIPAGADGQILFLHNNSNFTLTFQDESDLAGSNIRLGSADSTLRPKSVMSLLYDLGESIWVVFSNPNSSVGGANADIIAVRNQSGVSISAGKAVYVTSWNVGQGRPLVALADADATSTMPALGIAASTIASGANGDIIMSGTAVGLIDTSGASVNDGVWISGTAGEVVFTRPLTDEIQRIGTVVRAHANGVIIVTGAGRVNAVPKIFEATAITVGTTTLTSGIFEVASSTSFMFIGATGNVGIASTTPGKLFSVGNFFGVDSSGNVIGTWQGTIITDAYIADNLTATNYLLLAGGTISGELTVQSTTTFGGNLNFMSQEVDFLIRDNASNSLSVMLGTTTTKLLNFDTTNANELITFGADVSIGSLQIDEDSGAVTFVDFSVSATPAQGTEESYSFQIDSSSLLTIYSEADSSGGIQNKRVEIDTGATLRIEDLSNGFLKVDVNGDVSTSTIDISDNTNLVGGRSITISGDSVEADAELYTSMVTFSIRNATTTGNPVAQHKFATAITITRISCSTNSGTVTVQFDERAEATATTSGTDVMNAALVCDTDTQATTTFANAGIAADAPFSLDIDAVSAADLSVYIHIDFQRND